jgi:8-amino-7-oxononanoate synthase
MDGDIAPLSALVDLCNRHDAWLLVDDAHGFGALGVDGRGALSHFGIVSSRVIYMATLGKAAGVCGAFVAAKNEVVETLVQRARTYIYTTATPPLLAHALLVSLELIRSDAWRRARLHGLIRQLRARLRLRKWRLLPSQTPIQPIVIGGNEDAMRASNSLLAEGIFVPAIRPPTVRPNEARLRISLSAAHSGKDVDRLIEALHANEQ